MLNGAKITGGSISTVAGSAIGGDGEIDALKFINAGAIYSETQGLPAATLVINSPLINNGIIRAGNYGNSSGASLIINGAVTGTGSAVINGADELEVSSAFAENIRFAPGATGTLKLDAPAGFTRSLKGFAQGSIDLPHIGFGAGTTLSYTANNSNTGGTLHVSDGGSSADIKLFGHFQSAGFQDGNDGTGGTLIGYAVPIIWKSGTSGDFAAASNWSPATVPGPADAAEITATGNYTVTSSVSETIHSLSIAAEATLSMPSGTFVVAGRPGAITSAGTISVNTGAQLDVQQGAIENDGSIALSGTLQAGNFFSSSSQAVTLQGAGKVTLDNGSIQGATLINADNIISGVGIIDPQTLINESGGVINASGSGVPGGNNFLTISGQTLNNAGTILTTGLGDLSLQSFGNRGLVNSGTIAGTASFFGNVDNSGNIDLTGFASFSAGVQNSGTIQFTGPGGFDTITGPVTNSGQIELISNGNGAIPTSVSMGAVTNSGLIEVVGTPSDLNFPPSFTSLTIAGAVTGTGQETIDDASLVFGAAVSAGQQVTFSGTDSSLSLQHSPNFAGTIAGFGGSNSIDVQDINFNSADFSLNYTPNQANTAGVLTVSDGVKSAEINFLGNYTQANFVANTDGMSGTLITDPSVIEQQPGNAAATIADDTVLEVNTPDSGMVTFAGSTGTLWLDQPETFAGSVVGFWGAGPHRSCADRLRRTDALGFSETETGGTLTVSDGTHAAAIALLGNYIASSFSIRSRRARTPLITEAAQSANQQPMLTPPHG